VRAEIKSGSNWMGATAELARYLDVSPRMIRARCREELVGPSRMKRDIVEGCWTFLDMVAKRQLEWFGGIARDVARRADRQQLMLPLDLPSAGTLPGWTSPIPLSDVAARLDLAANEPANAMKARSA
jgi:hypothetical protein